jgi:hypothetical protein
MMATVPHVISGLGLRKFQADGFLLTRVDNNFYMFNANKCLAISWSSCLSHIFMTTPDGIMI